MPGRSTAQRAARCPGWLYSTTTRLERGPPTHPAGGGPVSHVRRAPRQSRLALIRATPPAPAKRSTAAGRCVCLASSVGREGSRLLSCTAGGLPSLHSESHSEVLAGGQCEPAGTILDEGCCAALPLIFVEITPAGHQVPESVSPAMVVGRLAWRRAPQHGHSLPTTGAPRTGAPLRSSRRSCRAQHIASKRSAPMRLE